MTPFSNLATVALAACCLGTFATPAAGQSQTQSPIQNLPADGLIWDETPEGVAFAALHGDRFVESYMAMVRLPAGLVSPPHVKSADMVGVVVSGAMVHRPAGADPNDDVTLPEGSFYRIPANVPHVSACVSDIQCVTFLYQDGPFDFRPITP